MKKLHLNFYELSEATQKELKQAILDDIDISGVASVNDQTKNSINKLFDTNNAGIDIDVYSWMSLK